MSTIRDLPAVLASAAGALTFVLLVVLLGAAPEFAPLLLGGSVFVGASLGYGLWTGATTATAFGTGMLTLVSTAALLAGDPETVTTAIVATGVWLVAVTGFGSLLVRVDAIAPEVAGSMVRWAAVLTLVGVVATGAAASIGRDLPERSIAVEALGALAAVVVVLGLLGLVTSSPAEH